MRLRHPWLQQSFGLTAAVVIRLWHSSLRVRTLAVDGSRHPWCPKQRPCIYAVWHDSIFAVLRARTAADALISQHHDGELIAGTARRLGFGVIRGSSTRGGAAALRAIEQMPHDRHLFITPDGPRGPRHVVKPGLIHAARCLRRPIVFIGVAYDRFWQMRSWDRTCVPKPFGTIYAIFSEPIAPPEDPGLGPTDLCCRLQQRFIQISRAAWRWSQAERGSVPADVLALFDSAETPSRNRHEAEVFLSTNE